MHHVIRTTTLILALAAGTQAATFGPVNPSSSAVTTYDSHSITFKVQGDGTIVGRGNNDYGQADAPEDQDF